LGFRSLKVSVEGRSRLDVGLILGDRSQDTRYAEFERVWHSRPHATALFAQKFVWIVFTTVLNDVSELQEQNRLVPVRCHYSFNESHSFQTIRTPSLLILGGRLETETAVHWLNGLHDHRDDGVTQHNVV